MEDRIKRLLKEVTAFKANSKEAVEDFRLKYISRKGSISELFEELKKVSVEEKKKIGKVLNELKQSAEAKLLALQESLDNTPTSSSDVDLTLPPIPNKVGNLHPLTLTKNRIIEIFERLGFNVADGPEIEDDW